VAPQTRTDVVPQNSQLIALGKRSQDEVEEAFEKDSSSSSQRKRPTNANPYATAAKFVDFAELFKSPKALEVVVASLMTVHSLHLVTVQPGPYQTVSWASLSSPFSFSCVVLVVVST
jgi:hypothetical protein